MGSWLLRGIPLTAVHIVARVLLAIAVVEKPLSSSTWKVLAVAAVVLVALLWGGVDGIRDARANPDPDDYADLTVRWLKAGLFAGVVAAVVCWIIGTWFMSGIGQASLPIEIIAGGSFTALLVYAPAFVGFSFGRWVVRRDQRKNEPEEDWSSHEERAAAHA
ncbi:MAG: B-4DMT family transporter [Gordonia sp.]|jgi:hypothetical protein|uniref:B-4DMT family transporter n=1 Tax=Gordonia sp. (in: high G+C Gram-positive bacteria) TaxID=84139 RepID=UPI001DC56925|nr:B-4DMT family transporter [Gordonia sp. (in: high G+C Gram-positive bacteria)]MCB1293184.1 B-4DMT family transporter [Gordonia sp. (in: high G+C Gram-positive bacteria)]HMS77607.1 B-4DMT family transporter [Gordonia sp. (in: high G+C Gram-positive bacteria)]HQV18212.1 B-4DMT family transporter [Gordonia sp. (in: high G+C Gram-positive bacteria)]